MYTSKFSPVLSGYRQKSKVKKYKSKQKKTTTIYSGEKEIMKEKTIQFSHTRELFQRLNW